MTTEFIIVIACLTAVVLMALSNLLLVFCFVRYVQVATERLISMWLDLEEPPEDNSLHDAEVGGMGGYPVFPIPRTDSDDMGNGQQNQDFK